jgi:membrane-bound lytic murein transglycosylase D
LHKTHKTHNLKPKRKQPMENDTLPNQTGGLKLVTVFIAVLALHVLVIGGISVYHLLKSPNLDEATLDYTRAQRPDPAAYNPTQTGSGIETAASLMQDSPPAPEPSSMHMAQANNELTPSFDARLSMPEPTPSEPYPAPASAPTFQTSTPTDYSTAAASPKAPIPAAPSAPSSYATAAPATHPSPIPYTPSLSDGVPQGYAEMQDPLPSPPQAAPEQLLTSPLSIPAAGDPYHQAPQQVLVTNPNNAVTHEVMPGETLAKIRALYGVSLAEIMAWNNIKDANRIRVGQKLTIHRTQAVTVPAPDTSGSYVATTAPSKKPQIKPTADKAEKKVIPSTVAVHRVSQGETLYSIARKYDTTVEKIIAVNPDQLSDPKRLRVGMRLVLPAHQVTTKKTIKPSNQARTASASIPISTDIVMR